MKKIIFILISMTVWYACSDKEPVVTTDSVFSTFIDERDGSEYLCVTIGGQTWMAENLHYRLPWGSYQGCYSYMEANIDSISFKADKAQFIARVTKALDDGILSDPDGSLKKYISYVSMGFWTIDQYFTQFESRPEVTAFLLPIKKELELESRVTVAMASLDKAELKNGGYKDKYGYLYTFQAAKAALPEGWDLPTDEDWKILEQTLGMSLSESDKMEYWRGTNEGVLLKEGELGIGFNVRMGGARLYGSLGYGTAFQNREADAYFWTSTEEGRDGSDKIMMIRKFFYNDDRVFRGTSKTNGVAYSVRGIKR